jgi:GNAT superfamily N-acetyltransferase
MKIRRSFISRDGRKIRRHSKDRRPERTGKPSLGRLVLHCTVALSVRASHLPGMNSSPEYKVSTDRGRLDRELIHRFLKETYWARGIPREVVDRGIDHSLCFGVYAGAQQVGFARVITDYATFAYVADVFILPEHRGRGLSKRLMSAIVEHPELQGLRRWVLATLDAHGLYAQFGFEPLTLPEHFMTIHRPEIYRTPAAD